jgi:predicted O-methyltransferase YrrM
VALVSPDGNAAGRQTIEEHVLSQLLMQPDPLARFPVKDGLREISPPVRFDGGGEEAYDETVGDANRADLLANGAGAWRLAEHYARRPLRRWLEVGAGGGTCTLGLVAAAPAALKIITDTSPVFLDMIRRKLARLGVSDRGCVYATLAGEHLKRLGPKSLDAIFVASAVHHIGDWRGFLAAAARALAPGGVLIVQEPFREGYLLMNMAMEIALAADWADQLSEDDGVKIRRCRDGAYLLADSAVEKAGEDKHLFLVDEIAAASDRAGFARHVFHRNSHFYNFAHGEPIEPSMKCTFCGYLLSFLDIHHRVSKAGLDVLTRRLTPVLAPVERLFLQGDGPALTACVAFLR